MQKLTSRLRSQSLYESPYEHDLFGRTFTTPKDSMGGHLRHQKKYLVNIWKKHDSRLDEHLFDVYRCSLEVSSDRSKGQICHENRTVMKSGQQSNPQPLYTVTETCELLSIGRSTFYKEVNEGRLVPIKIGRSTRITSESLVRYTQNKIDEARSFRAQNPGRWS